jgi:DnaK suppressor protein
LDTEIMRKAFLKTARESLLTMRRQVGADIENETKSSREGQKDEGMDAYDLASEERDRDISMILSDRDRAKMQAIDEALERINNGEYGACESCGAPITFKRLMARPVATLCIDCKTEAEQVESRKRVF